MGISLISYDSCFLTEEIKMKPVNHQKTPTTIGETPSNNKNNKKEKMRDNKEICGLKASAGKRAERHAAEPVSFQEPR
jgi:hypothetical protein